MSKNCLNTDWNMFTLDDIGRIITGKTPPTSVQAYFNGDIPFVTPSDMDGRKVISATERYLTEAGVEAVKGAKLPKGAVMVSCIGSDMGKVALAGKDCVTNQQLNSIIVNEDHCPHYVYYNLSSRKNELRSLAGSGSAQPILNKGHFSQLTMCCPPLKEEEEAIARVLSALDDKIELNRRMNETLDAMARALFKSWFVDFDPVRAKAEGRTPYGMDAETATLFPSTFEDSDLGEIPKGWSVSTLGDIAKISKAILSPNDFPNEEFDHFSIPAFDERKYPALELGEEIQSNKFVIEGNAALVSKLNPRIFRAWTVFAPRQRRSIASTEFIIYHPKQQNLWSLLNCLVRSDDIIAEFQSHATGTSGSHQRVRPEDTLSFSCVLSTEKIHEIFERTCSFYLRQIDQNIEQSQTLASLRDLILPKLLSGELSVQDARRKIAEVV